VKLLKRGGMLCVVLLGAALLVGCQTARAGAGTVEAEHRPEMLLSLPDYCNTPDAMAEDGDDNIIMSVPNFNDPTYPGILTKITPENQLSIFFPMPVHPETKRSGPMGLDFGPDDNLYVADCQFFYDDDHASRIVKVNMEDGEPVSSEVVVEGFNLSNAVKWKGDEMFVTETTLGLPDQPEKSGVYRFSMGELTGDKPVQLQPGVDDPHLLAVLETKPNPEDNLMGADGMCFDGEGNLYTGNFGDGALFRVTFDEDGNKAKQEVVYRNNDVLPCIDGIYCDKSAGKIYITDSQQNAIHVYDISEDSLNKLWENGDTDGSGGLLDQPCEPRLRDDELIVVNFDSPMPGLKNSEWDKPYTVSVIDLD